MSIKLLEGEFFEIISLNSISRAGIIIYVLILYKNLDPFKPILKNEKYMKFNIYSLTNSYKCGKE